MKKRGRVEMKHKTRTDSKKNKRIADDRTNTNMS